MKLFEDCNVCRWVNECNTIRDFARGESTISFHCPLEQSSPNAQPSSEIEKGSDSEEAEVSEQNREGWVKKLSGECQRDGCNHVFKEGDEFYYDIPRRKTYCSEECIRIAKRGLFI